MLPEEDAWIWIEACSAAAERNWGRGGRGLGEPGYHIAAPRVSLTRDRVREAGRAFWAEAGQSGPSTCVLAQLSDDRCPSVSTTPYPARTCQRRRRSRYPPAAAAIPSSSSPPVSSGRLRLSVPLASLGESCFAGRRIRIQKIHFVFAAWWRLEPGSLVGLYWSDRLVSRPSPRRCTGVNEFDGVCSWLGFCVGYAACVGLGVRIPLLLNSVSTSPHIESLNGVTM
jgi:hypothetical protein